MKSKTYQTIKRNPLKKASIVRPLQSFLVLLLLCLSAQAKEIPKRSHCIDSLKRVSFFQKLFSKQSSNDLYIKAERQQSPGEFNDFLGEIVLLVKKRRMTKKKAVEYLLATGYAIDMDMAPEQINNILQKSLKAYKGKKDNKNLSHITKNAIINELEAFKNGDKSFTHQRLYDDVLSQLTIKNQCRFGSCWAYGSTTYLEYFLRAFGHQGEELSEDYHYAHFIFDSYLEKINTPSMAKEKFNEAGSFIEYIVRMERIGSIPKKDYIVNNPDYKGTGKKEFLAQLDNIVDKRLKGQLDQLQAEEEIKKVIEENIGELSPTIKSEGETTTPLQYFQKHISQHYRMPQYVQIREEYEVLAESIIKENLKKNRPVVLHFDVPREPIIGKGYIDEKSGMMILNEEISIFHKPEIRGAHIVVITGAEYDLNGKIRTLKIHNSWGDQIHDEGILHMDRNFLYHFGRGISFLKEE